MLLLDIMAYEWTNHLFYRPGLIAVSLGPTKATVKISENQKNWELTEMYVIQI